MFTSNQIAALTYIIFNAKDGTELSKRVLTFLVELSGFLTKEVCLSLVAGREGYTAGEIRAAGHGVHDMESSQGTTHLNQILDAMGSKLKFSVHYGYFDPARNGDALVWQESDSCTFWLSKETYSRQATLIVATRKELGKINLMKPGLYPSLEPAA